MKIQQLFLIVAAGALVACQPKTVKNNDGDNFQCIAATLTIAGKPVTSVVQWNTKTGATRIIDSTTIVSRTGAQNTVVGWAQLGDLQAAVQEVVARDQAQQQAQQQTAQARQQQQQNGVTPPEAPAPTKAAPKKK